MIPIKFFMCCLIVTMVSSISFAYLIDSEFNNPADPADSIYTKWASAGSNAVINSVFTIDVTAIPDTMTYKFEGNDIPIPDAQTGDGIDNSQIIRFDTSLLIVV